MCSKIDNESDLPAVASEAANGSTIDAERKECSKCKTVSAAVFVQGNASCKDCFLTTSEHKFRAELTKFLKELGKGSEPFKSHLANAVKRLVLAFSGSMTSLLLLHMLVGEREKKRISSELEIIVLFVREPCHSDSWCKLVEDYLRSCCGPFTWQTIDVKYNDLLVGNSGFATDALQQAAILARNRTISDFAKSMECDGVIFSSCQNSLAVNLLRDVSLGYAERAAYTAAVVDRLTCFGVPLGRPFRGLSSKEAVFLFRFLNVKELPFLDLNMGKFSGSSTSVGLMCQNMITEVGAEYPATATTAFRTAAKLDTETKQQNTLRCSICYCCFDPADSNLNCSVCYGCHALELEKLLPTCV